MESNTNQPKHTASEKDSTIDIKEEFPTLASDNKANVIQAALTEQNTLNQTSMDIDEDKKNININTTTSPPPITTTTTSLPSTGIPQNECNILTPTLADILSDDLMLRFYQCVKDIRLQRSPTQTSSMFFALCHALGDTISFLKVPNMNKIMFRQDEQIFAVNISGIVPPVSDNNSNNNNNNNSNNNQSLQQSADNLNILANVHYDNTNNNNVTPISSSTSSNQYTQMDNNHNNNNTTPSSSTTSTLAAAAAAAANFFSANDQSQQLLQAALSTVNPHDPNHPLLPNVLNPVSEGGPNISNTKSKTPKKPKKPSPRDKEYAVRRNEIIQDLLKVTEANLLHQANTVDEDIKLIIQGQERNTKLGLLSPLHRFATFANLTAHYDSDFAPKNAGVYYNYEYFQLFLAFRDLELERTQQMQHHKQQNESVPKQSSSTSTSISSPSASTSSSTPTSAPTSTPPVNYTTTSLSRPVMTQCRADIEKVLVNTNWEAIRRRLIIGERIYQLSNVIGRGFLLLSKQVSGRKLLHNFNTTEWTLLLHEFERPESLPLLRVLQTKYSPERLYQHHHPENAIYSQGMTESAAAAAAAEAMKVLPLLSQSQQQPSQSNMPTTSLTPSSSSTSSPPPKAYVDNNNNNINNNGNESNQVASSNNYIASLPHTTTTNNTLTASSMIPENTSTINNDQRENNNDNNPISSNDNNDFYQNINDHQDGSRRKKLKTKE